MEEFFNGLESILRDYSAQLAILLAAIGYLIRSIMESRIRKKEYFRDKQFDSFKKVVSNTNNLYTNLNILRQNILIHYRDVIKISNWDIPREQLAFEIETSKIAEAISDFNTSFIEMVTLSKKKSRHEVARLHEEMKEELDNILDSISLILHQSERQSVRQEEIVSLEKKLQNFQQSFEKHIKQIETLFLKYVQS